MRHMFSQVEKSIKAVFFFQRKRLTFEPQLFHYACNITLERIQLVLNRNN